MHGRIVTSETGRVMAWVIAALDPLDAVREILMIRH